MATLFVDVDDTLILYDGVGIHPYGLYSPEGWRSEPLIERLRAPHRRVWSGGGAEYAQIIGDHVLGTLQFKVLEKSDENMVLIQLGDMLVAAAPIPTRTQEPLDDS
jgi:hypothetical protein